MNSCALYKCVRQRIHDALCGSSDERSLGCRQPCWRQFHRRGSVAAQNAIEEHANGARIKNECAVTSARSREKVCPVKGSGQLAGGVGKGSKTGIPKFD